MPIYLVSNNMTIKKKKKLIDKTKFKNNHLYWGNEPLGNIG